MRAPKAPASRLGRRDGRPDGRSYATSAEFIENYGALTDRALSEAVTITRNGRNRFVVLSAEEYARLKRRDRRVVELEAFSEDEMARIAQAEVPADCAHLDEELKDSRG